MGKKVDKRWKTVKFENLSANITNADFEGLVGIEECYDYGVTCSKKGKFASKFEKKRKLLNSSTDDSSVAKKLKTSSNGDFVVDSWVPSVSISPSKTNCDLKTTVGKNKQKKNKKEKIDADSKNAESQPESKDNTVKSKKKKKKKQTHLKKSTSIEVEDGLPLDQMQAWSSFGIPEPILQALADKRFKQPTPIQELTLPAAMHGRRDILGAAETGSGKTLAFGIPIISGIMELKEKVSQGENIDFIKLSSKISPYEDTSKPKIINFNKLSKEEIKNLKTIRKKNKGRFQKMPTDSDDSDDELIDSEDDSDLDDDDDDNLSESEKNTSNEENDSSGEDSEKDIGNNESDDSETDDADSDMENNSASEIDDKHSLHENMDVIKDNKSIKKNNFSECDESILENDLTDQLINTEDDNLENTTGTIISNPNLKPLYALILTPTRELAIQVKNHLIAAAKHTDIRIAVVVGGMAQVKQERILEKCPEIVVATPGRLWEMIQQGNDHLAQVADIRYLAIDETDRMVERGHFEELHLLLDKINDNEYKRAKRQNFVFSATLTMVHELPFHLKTKKVTKKGKIINKKIEKLTSEQKLKKLIDLLGISNPKIVDVTQKNQGSSNTLTECRIVCPIDQKDYYLYYVLKRHPGRTIVFCNSIGCVKRLSQLFGLLRCDPLPLHASMQQRQRLKNLDRFRESSLGLLIATDVAARGLDIPNVEHVIHYQVPRTAENYVHRSGRTARASKEGIAILIMEPGEVQNYMRLCRTLSKAEDLPHFPVTEAILSATMQRVNLARELDQIELKMRKLNSEIGWYEKSMREMDIILDEREMPQKLEKDVAADQRLLLSTKKKLLNGLLSTHLFPKGYSFKYPTSNDMASEELTFGKKQNAIEAMKSALETGLVKKLKKASKNEAALKLNNKESVQEAEEQSSKGSQNENSKKFKKNKWKKMKKSEMK